MDALGIILLCLGLLALASIIYFLAYWYCNSTQKGLSDTYQPLSRDSNTTAGTPYSDVTQVIVDADTLDEPDSKAKLIAEEGVYDSNTIERGIYPKVIVGSAIAASLTSGKDENEKQQGSASPNVSVYPDINDVKTLPRNSTSTPKEGIYESAEDVKEYNVEVIDETRSVPEGKLVDIDDDKPKEMVLRSISYADDEEAPAEGIMLTKMIPKNTSDSASISSEEAEDVKPEALMDVANTTEERLSDSDKEMEAMTPSVSAAPMAHEESFDSDAESDQKKGDKEPEADNTIIEVETPYSMPAKEKADDDAVPEEKPKEDLEDAAVPEEKHEDAVLEKSSVKDDVSEEKPNEDVVFVNESSDKNVPEEKPNDDVPEEKFENDDAPEKCDDVPKGDDIPVVYPVERKCSSSSSSDSEPEPEKERVEPVVVHLVGTPNPVERNELESRDEPFDSSADSPMKECSSDDESKPSEETSPIPEPLPEETSSLEPDSSPEEPSRIRRSVIDKYENGLHCTEITVTTETEDGRVIKEETMVHYEPIGGPENRKKVHPDEGYGTIETSLDPDKSYEEIMDENGPKDSSSSDEEGNTNLDVPSKDNRHSIISDGAEANREVAECHVENNFIEKKSETSV